MGLVICNFYINLLVLVLQSVFSVPFVEVLVVQIGFGKLLNCSLSSKHFCI